MEHQPGWYPHGEIWRYHDGTDWTDSYREHKPLSAEEQKARNRRQLRWLIPVSVVIIAGSVAYAAMR